MTTNSNLLCFSQAVKGSYEYPSSAAIIIQENQVNTLLQSTINAAKNDIYNLINTNTLPRGKRHIDHPLNGGFVRLAFHDCVGGCDGCINHNNRDNGGLSRYTSLLNPICDKYIEEMSRADCWMLAAVTAIEHAWGNAMTLCVTNNGNKLQRKDAFPEKKKHDIETDLGVKDDGRKSIASQNEASLERETIKRKGGSTGIEKVGVSKRKINNEIDNIKMNRNREKSSESGMRHETNKPRKKRSDIICTPFGLIFRYGRKDCATSPITSLNRKFPNPHGNLHHTLKYFKNEFGFSAGETVALMGAHALGVAHRGASGFDGRWSCGDYLVHKFYKDLVNAGHGWKQIGLRSTKTLQGPFYQWVFSDNRRCFLNTDMSLYKKIRPNSHGKTTCDYNNCPRAATADIVELYAKNFSAWLPDFFSVFQKMIEHGSTNLSR